MRFDYSCPNFNQVRYLKRFAIFPFIYGEKPNQKIVWLEWYWHKQKTSGNYGWYCAGKHLIEHDRSDATQ